MFTRSLAASVDRSPLKRPGGGASKHLLEPRVTSARRISAAYYRLREPPESGRYCSILGVSTRYSTWTMASGPACLFPVPPAYSLGASGSKSNFGHDSTLEMGELSTSCQRLSLRASRSGRLAVSIHLQQTARGIARSTPLPPYLVPIQKDHFQLLPLIPTPVKHATHIKATVACSPQKVPPLQRKRKGPRRERQGGATSAVDPPVKHPIGATVACLLTKASLNPQ